MTSESWAATPVDYDRDGDEDVFISRHDQGARLMSNDGNGVYREVARGTWSAINSEGKRPDRHQCVWADVDKNGLPDAYCATGRGSNNLVKTGKDNELWLQRPAGTFTEVGTAWGVGDICGRSQTAAFLDANGDSFPDLYVGNARSRGIATDPCKDPALNYSNEYNKLYINAGGRGFTDQAARFGLGRLNGGTRHTLAADYDGDGWTDLLLTGADAARLLRNESGVRFADVSTANHIGRDANGAAFCDLDRDGDLDLVETTGKVTSYHLNSEGRIGAAVRAAALDTGSARAVVVGDADGDADVDVFVVAGAPTVNPADLLLVNDGRAHPGFSVVRAPAARGLGDSAAALDGNVDGRTEFLVLNGRAVAGPVQLLRIAGSP